MHSSLRFFRYFVFGLFLVCNAIIITAAVWNLNDVQNALFPSSSLSSQTDAYLIFVGCAGLALIIPVLFCELASKSIFLVSVWFECTWVALFCIMELAGAASASAAGADELCPPVYWIANAVDRGSICTSSRLLQAFSWICGLLLLAYFVLLFVTTLLLRREDSTIWRCSAGRFPWAGAHHKLDAPASPTEKPQEKRRSFIASVTRKLSGKSGKAPTIACPRPRNAASEAVRRAILSYRSGLSADYTIEHFRPEDEESHGERPLPPAPLLVAPEPPSMVTREATAITFGHSLYPQHMHSVLPLDRQAQAPPSQRRAQSEETPRSPPTPSPIGDWPRMNPSTPRPKRKSQRLPPLVTESRQRQQSYPPLGSQTGFGERQPSFPPVASGSALASATSPMRPLPTFDFESSRLSVSQVVPPSSTLRSAPPPVLPPLNTLPPPTSFPSSRSRPSGPRRPSLEENRDPAHVGSYNYPRHNVPMTRS